MLVTAKAGFGRLRRSRPTYVHRDQRTFVGQHRIPGALETNLLGWSGLERSTAAATFAP